MKTAHQRKEEYTFYPTNSWLQICNITTDGSFWTISTARLVDDAQQGIKIQLISYLKQVFIDLFMASPVPREQYSQVFSILYSYLVYQFTQTADGACTDCRRNEFVQKWKYRHVNIKFNYCVSSIFQYPYAQNHHNFQGIQVLNYWDIFRNN